LRGRAGIFQLSLFAACLLAICLLATCLPASPAFAASDEEGLKIELALSRSTIELGKQVSLTISVIGPSGFSEPGIPKIDGLDIVTRGRTQSVRIINMKVRSSKIFGYAVVPNRAGEFVIGPVHIRRGGMTYTSNTVKLIVMEPDKKHKAAPAAKGVIVEAAFDNVNPYVGQQITLMFRFARKAGVRIGNAGYELPALSGFWREGVEGKREYRRRIGGTEYLVAEITVPMFPTEQGTIVIDPIKFHYDEFIPGERSRSAFPRDPFGSFLRGDRAVRREAITAPIEISVRPLPLQDRPDDFKGGVGSFEISTQISDEEVARGESATLTVVLSGQGNIRDVADPEFSFENTKTYSDKPAISVKRYSDRIVGQKTYKIALVPQQGDSVSIPPISISFFNPETERYETASSAPLTLGVLASERDELEIVDSRPFSRQKRGPARSDILPIHERYGSIVSSRLAVLWPRLRPFAYPLPAIFYALCFMASGRRKRLLTDVAYRRRKRASRNAISHIETASGAARRQDWDEVFTGCSRAVTEFLADSLNVPAGGMTPADVGTLLSEKGAPEELSTDIVKFLEGCDYGRFAAPGESPDAAKKCIRGARKTLDRLKREGTIR
jgi:hypothetical protein